MAGDAAMTDQQQPPGPGPQASPDPLRLRARPQPVTRINRKVVIGGAALLLVLVSLIVLLALKPPGLHVADRQELFNVDYKPVTDALSKLPASYDAVQPENKPDAGKQPAVPILSPGVPSLKVPAADPLAEAEHMEIARLARMAGQARESGVFFRLQLKTPPAKETVKKGAPADPAPKEASAASDGGLASVTALRAADRALALAGGDPDVIGAAISTAEATRKLSFLKAGPEKEVYNQHGLQTPVSAYQLMAGTVISASLVTGLNSDLPGFVIAQVTEHVYDTVSGRFLLIPQGSRLVGKYDNIVAFGQERALVIWQRIILPDGSSIVIDNLPATDTGGYAGLADEVDLHTWKLLKGVALATVLGVGSELAFGSSENDLVKALQQATQLTTDRAGQRLVERNLNVQPTITVRPGWPLRVIVHKDL
ncbi:MAG: TrbI/VirB10 family protein, partial [Hyphomicrobiaceae bacterium]|nr:TrbI/VirB10 family protein [Hyphomicrobiaceae bacterium]